MEEAQKRAWATVNKQSGGGDNGGSGLEKSATAKRVARSNSAKKAATTRRKNAVKKIATTKKVSD